MENKQKGIKGYWNILKEELSKNKRAFFLLFLSFVIFTSFLLWAAPASSSVTERLIMAAPFVVPFILFILFVLSIVIVNRRKYENFIVGKNPWEIAEINFRRYAKSLLVMVVAFAIIKISLSLFPHPYSGMEILISLETFFVFVIWESFLFSLISLLLKRRSPKVFAVGYIGLISFLILAVYLCFNSLFENKHESFLIFLFLFPIQFPIQGLVDIYKASKYTADIKRDSELQKEIIKIKEEEK